MMQGQKNIKLRNTSVTTYAWNIVTKSLI